MTTKELLGIVSERGLRIVLKDGRPVLERASKSQNVTDKLLAVLARHRERIVEYLSKSAPRPVFKSSDRPIADDPE